MRSLIERKLECVVCDCEGYREREEILGEKPTEFGFSESNERGEIERSRPSLSLALDFLVCTAVQFCGYFHEQVTITLDQHVISPSVFHISSNVYISVVTLTKSIIHPANKSMNIREKLNCSSPCCSCNCCCCCPSCFSNSILPEIQVENNPRKIIGNWERSYDRFYVD